MSDRSDLELDMREFCALVLQEYEDVIAQIIQRPIPKAHVESGPGIGALALDGALLSEPA